MTFTLTLLLETLHPVHSGHVMLCDTDTKGIFLTW